MRYILGVDVDSTVWDPSIPIAKAVLDITGETLDPETCATWSDILDIYGEEAAMEIYTRTLAPHRVRERNPYPGAVEVLRYLQEECSLLIHFITYNGNPEGMEPHLRPWLQEHFGPHVGLTVATENKLSILRALGAFGMVDDRLETITCVADAGLWAATILQPWNRELVTARSDIHGFENWCEIPNLLLPLLNNT